MNEWAAFTHNTYDLNVEIRPTVRPGTSISNKWQVIIRKGKGNSKEEIANRKTI